MLLAKRHYCLFLLLFSTSCLYTNVSGHVFDSKGNPISEAYVGLGWRSDDNSAFASVYTDQKGFYRIRQRSVCLFMCTGGAPPFTVHKEGFHTYEGYATQSSQTGRNVALIHKSEMNEKMYEDMLLLEPIKFLAKYPEFKGQLPIQYADP